MWGADLYTELGPEFVNTNFLSNRRIDSDGDVSNHIQALLMML